MNWLLFCFATSYRLILSFFVGYDYFEMQSWRIHCIIILAVVFLMILFDFLIRIVSSCRHILCLMMMLRFNSHLVTPYFAFGGWSWLDLSWVELKNTLLPLADFWPLDLSGIFLRRFLLTGRSIHHNIASIDEFTYFCWKIGRILVHQFRLMQCSSEKFHHFLALDYRWSLLV